MFNYGAMLLCSYNTFQSQSLKFINLLMLVYTHTLRLPNNIIAQKLKNKSTVSNKLWCNVTKPADT